MARSYALATVCFFLACGRNDIETPTGDLGGACYGNDSCNGDLVCNGAGLCMERDPCAGVGCSGHGECRASASGPACVCESDYRAEGLRCVDCGFPGCAGCTSCALGAACVQATACNSLFCQDGVCALPRSCAELHAATPSLPDGPYEIAPLDTSRLVYCDMTTDGGGWTMVSSTVTTAVSDRASEYYADLATLQPTVENAGVWDEMRALIPGGSDLRFGCKVNVIDAALTVDLSIYDSDWYLIITTGSDSQSCFFPNVHVGDVPPARRNNITGEERPVGDEWDAGDFIGEDACNDGNDFSVDFDDQGLDSNELDGTDWGLDDGSSKCGTVYPLNGAWFIWVRE